MCKHYVYRHIREDKNEPFYIGIGTKHSMPSDGLFNSYETEFRRGVDIKNRSKEWGNVFSDSNKNISIEILYETSSIDEAMRKEMEFINMYGRGVDGGTLVNKSIGGYSNFGWIPSDDFRNKIRLIRTGCRLSEETKKKIGEKNKGQIRTKEYIDRISKIRKSLPRSEKQICHLKKLIHKMRIEKRVVSDETKLKLSAANSGKVRAKSVKVAQVDLNGNVLEVFMSTMKAQVATGINKSNIRECIVGKRKTAGGFTWTKAN